MIAKIGLKNSTEGHVIEILSREFPLTAMQIYNRAKKIHSCGLRYRTFHKHLAKLVKHGILQKKNKKYQLNCKWLKNIRNFITSVESKYSTHNSDIVNFMTFYNLHEFSEFLISFRKEALSKLENTEIFFIGDHLWLPLFYLKDTISGIYKLKEKNIKYHIKVRGDTKLDRVFVNMYRSVGAEHVKHGVSGLGRYIIYIYGDVMLLITRPDKITNEIEELFQTTKNLQDLNLARTFEKILLSPCFFHAIVVRNPKIIESYKTIIKAL